MEVPLRWQVKDAPTAPSSAKLAADALEAEHRRRAAIRREEAEKTAAKQAQARLEARLRREKEAKAREEARKKASAGAAAKVKKAAEAAAEVEQQKRAADDAALRAHMQKRLDAEERERTKDVNVEEEAAKRMREAERRWREQQKRMPADPYAEWRGAKGARRAEEDDDDDEGEEELPEDATEEERLQLAARKAKAKERDVAARRILAHSSKTLMDALGLPETASDVEVDRTMRKVLRLLHPDYSINLASKGTRRHERIEAAFKRLNGLRAEAEEIS